MQFTIEQLQAIKEKLAGVKIGDKDAFSGLVDMQKELTDSESYNSKLKIAKSEIETKKNKYADNNKVLSEKLALISAEKEKLIDSQMSDDDKVKIENWNPRITEDFNALTKKVEEVTLKFTDSETKRLEAEKLANENKISSLWQSIERKLQEKLITNNGNGIKPVFIDWIIDNAKKQGNIKLNEQKTGFDFTVFDGDTPSTSTIDKLAEHIIFKNEDMCKPTNGAQPGQQRSTNTMQSSNSVHDGYKDAWKNL